MSNYLLGILQTHQRELLGLGRKDDKKTKKDDDDDDDNSQIQPESEEGGLTTDVPSDTTMSDSDDDWSYQRVAHTGITPSFEVSSLLLI